MNPVPTKNPLFADAISLDSLPKMEADEVFPHVLSMPMICPRCGEEWAVLMSQEGLSAEMRIYREGYIPLLARALGRDCPHATGQSNDDPLAKHAIEWYRTDGRAVWVEIPATLRESIEAFESSVYVC